MPVAVVSGSGGLVGSECVRRLVESYGGTVEVDSTGDLVTFTVAVPTVVSVVAEGGAGPEPAAVGAPHQPNG